jgi:hypothetical protein
MINNHNIEIVYSNGCSHSAAGGLELVRTVDDKKTLITDVYKEKYNVSWKTQEDATYIAHLASLLGGIEYVADAASGGGTGRVIRLAYDFVKRNWDKKDKLFLVLEFPAFFQRIDMFSVKLNHWMVINQSFSNTGRRNHLYATRKYFVDEFANDLRLIDSEKELTNYLDNFTRIDIEEEKLIREIETFLSFLKFNNIKHIWFEGGNLTQPKIDKSLLENELSINDEIGHHTDFHNWITKHKLTIKDELEGLSTDLHPGYFGHKKFADILYEHISKNYNM